ncbi:hypothetical protein QFC22_004059 [Naganishia vaughanmartiniae]|uniref:Uncharacterized protein n=1 Tax=Naganishia vaughanmartiniae TaxID=1424756 RepID=A0ACC2X440_9TREE|nr:hypothetical protein QFC22_004059 [Naganishia vaughanmartiniae]
MSAIRTENQGAEEIDTNSTLNEGVKMDKPVASQVEHRNTNYEGGDKIGRRLTDDSLHRDHPINLPRWRKNAILITLAWSGFLANYSASAHLTAFPQMAAYFGVTPSLVAQSIGYSLLGIAVGPIFYNPMSRTIGRRPTYLLGSALFIPCVIWMALSKDYAVFCAGRFFAGFFSAFSQTVPPASIADIYPPEVRGDKMAIFGVACILSPAISPLIGGLVIEYQHKWQIIYWIVLGFAGLQLLMFIFLVPETLWVEDAAAQQPVEAMQVEDGQKTLNGQPIRSGKRGSSWMPWHRPAEFAALAWSPIAMARYFVITLPSFYYGILFAWSVGITVVIPRIFEEPPYNFKTVIIGVTYLAFGIGSVLGKWSGGIVGDKVVLAITRRKGGIRKPEYRFYALLPILPFMFIGLLIVGLTLKYETHWIGPLIGGALFYYCLVASTGIIQTYVLETYLTKSMDTQANFIFWKCIWGFVVTYFAYEWVVADGVLTAFAVQGAIATGMGLLVCILLLWKGEAFRHAQNMPKAEFKLA